MSNILRVTGKAVFIISAISGIIKWLTWEPSISVLEKEFTFWTFLVYLIVGYFSAILLYGFAEVIDYLSEISSNSYEVCKFMQERKEEINQRDQIFETSKTVQKVYPQATTKIHISSDGWVCPKCQTKNRREDLYCRGCGKYR